MKLHLHTDEMDLLVCLVQRDLRYVNAEEQCMLYIHYQGCTVTVNPARNTSDSFSI